MTHSNVLDKNVNTIYLSEKEAILKNEIISDQDPFDKIFSSMKEEIWYVDQFDY